MSRRRTIGLITTFISGRFFEQIMSGVQEVAWHNQVDVLVIHGTPEHIALTGVAQQCVDGWIVLTYTQGMDLLAQQNKPIVTISCRVPGQNFSAVFPDNRQGTKAIMDHLISQGHQRIAFVGDTSIGDIQERYTTYQAVLKRNNIPFDPELVLITDNPLADRGALAARRLISSQIPFTAVVAGNDWTAIGLMRALQEQGYNIPGDIAVVGFDDIPEAQVTNPPLSTVRQQSDKLGETAARLLIDQIAGQLTESAVHYIPTNFVQRESSGGSLIGQIFEWKSPEIPTDAHWQAALSKELVRVLMPAISEASDPSPAQIWPEVDKLIQMLTATINAAGSETINRGAMQTIFSTPPILNASPEILLDMMRVLETAGLAFARQSTNPVDAKQRLHILCDQLSIEMMRSYRRRQNTSQHTLSEILQSQYNISQLLLQYPPQQIDWLKETPMFSGCLGLWSPSGGDQPPVLSVAGCYQREGSPSIRVGTNFSASQFPPIDQLPSASQKKRITTSLLLPVRTADHDWGMLAVSGPLISNDPWLEDNTVNTLEICCGFLGLALEREVLQESLRHVNENEQMLSDRVRELTTRLPDSSG